MAYSESTWKKHFSAIACLNKFGTENNANIIWPLTNDTVNSFCNWALNIKKLKPATVEAYLSSIATVHKLNLLDDSACHNFISKTLVKGAENSLIYEANSRKHRCAMSIHILKILGHEIAKSDWCENSKQIIWTTSCLAFFGSFRIGELLCNSSTKYDPFTSLLWRDLQFINDGCIVHVKSPKSRTPGGEFVDIFEFKGHNCCPVKALLKLKEKSKNTNNPDLPVFMFDSGIILSKQCFNEKVKILLEGSIENKGKHFSGHSFRAGIPTALARHPEMVKDSHIMGWGRWDSPAFLVYTRLKTPQKRFLFEKITSVLND